MKRIYFLFLVLFTTGSFSQNVEFTKENFDDQEGLKEQVKNLKEGDKLFSKKDPALYPQAVDLYLKANGFNRKNAVLNFKIGACYLNMPGSENKSLEYFTAAKSINPKVDIKIDYAIAQALQYNSEYDKAITQYNAFLNGLDNTNRQSMQETVDGKIRECMVAMEGEVGKDENRNADETAISSNPVNETDPVENTPVSDVPEKTEPVKTESKPEQGKTQGNTEKVTSYAPSQKYDIYKVLIITSKIRKTPEELHLVYNGEYPIEELYNEEMYKYYIGAFTNYEKALELKNKCGVGGAIIVGKKSLNDYVPVDEKAMADNPVKTDNPVNNDTQKNGNQGNTTVKNDNPVNTSGEKPDMTGVVFKVQISSTSTKQPITKLRQVYSGDLKIEESFSGGLYKYTIGNVKSYAEAVDIKTKCGVAGAFIIGYKNGERISDIKPYAK